MFFMCLILVIILSLVINTFMQILSFILTTLPVNVSFHLTHRSQDYTVESFFFFIAEVKDLIDKDFARVFVLVFQFIVLFIILLSLKNKVTKHAYENGKLFFLFVLIFNGVLIVTKLWVRQTSNRIDDVNTYVKLQFERLLIKNETGFVEKVQNYMLQKKCCGFHESYDLLHGTKLDNGLQYPTFCAQQFYLSSGCYTKFLHNYFKRNSFYENVEALNYIFCVILVLLDGLSAIFSFAWIKAKTFPSMPRMTRVESLPENLNMDELEPQQVPVEHPNRLNRVVPLRLTSSNQSIHCDFNR